MPLLETELAALLADAMPAHDRTFTIAVMARIERRRVRMEIILNTMMAIALAPLLYLLAPFLTGLAQMATGNLAVALMMTVVVLVAMQWSLHRMEI